MSAAGNKRHAIGSAPALPDALRRPPNQTNQFSWGIT